MPLLQETGRFPAKSTAAEFGQSEQGTPFLQISFETESGSITGWLYLSEKAIAQSVKTLRQAFEFDGNFETAVEQVVNKECSITVENEPYQGQPKLKVKWINSARSSAPISDQAAFLKTLTAKAARIPKEAPKAQAPTRPQAQRPPAAKPVAKVQEGIDEDVPF